VKAISDGRVNMAVVSMVSLWTLVKRAPDYAGGIQNTTQVPR